MKLTAENLKKSIRNDIPDLDRIWEELNTEIRLRVEEIKAEKIAGISPIPILEFEDILNNREAIDIDRLKQRGCVIIKNVFPQKMAEDWNLEVEDDAAPNRISLSPQVEFIGDSIMVHFLDSYLRLNDVNWPFNKQNQLIIKEKAFIAQNFSIPRSKTKT